MTTELTQSEKVALYEDAWYSLGRAYDAVDRLPESSLRNDLRVMLMEWRLAVGLRVRDEFGALLEQIKLPPTEENSCT